MVKAIQRSLEAKLASIKDPDYDDSDGDDDNEDNEPETISTKRGKGSKRKGQKKDAAELSTEEKSDQPSTVIYLGHLPVGFEEREITVFLNQFGNVKRCRVSRSKKTGRSRGYAFVDFADHEVAKIVAETMSGYFLLEKRLVCHLLPMDKVHELMFARPKRPVSKAAMQKKAMLEVNKRRSVEVLKGITAKLVEREELKRKKLAALGIDYDFPGYAASAQAVAANRGAADSESGSKRKMPVDIEETEDNTAKDANESKAAKTPKSNKKKSKKGKDSNTELAEKSEEVEKTEGAEKKSEKKKRKKSGDEPTESVPETPSQTEVEKSSKKSAKKTKTEKTPSKTKTPKSAKSSSKKKKSAE